MSIVVTDEYFPVYVSLFVKQEKEEENFGGI